MVVLVGGAFFFERGILVCAQAHADTRGENGLQGYLAYETATP